MGSSISECPRCLSYKHVRLTAVNFMHFKYKCSSCDHEFEVAKRRMRNK